MAYNSRFILAKGINLDKNHLNVLDYSESSMVSLCQSKAVYQGNDFQFIRDTGRISIRATYSQAVTANYIAFQNPDYANKWFFAFIDHVIYKSDSVVEIEYTVDDWATWYSFFTYLECYVLREHAANDAVGANIVPEDFSYDDIDLILYANQSLSVANSVVFCVGVTGAPENSDPVAGGGIYGRVPAGYRTYAFSTAAALQAFVLLYKDEPEKIIGVWAVPSDFFDPDDPIYSESSAAYIPINDNDGYSKDDPISPITPTFGGYTPVNNKLYTYPYTFYKLTNNLGASMVLARERFEGSPNFRSVGSNAATGGMVTFPTNYKKGSGVVIPLEQNIAVNAFPSGGWQGDAIAQWLANNGISTAVQTATSIGGTIAGLAMMTNPATLPIGIATAIGSVGNTIGNLANKKSQLYHAANPCKGGANNISGLMALGADALKPRLESYCVNAQIAKIIDDYFTKYGYATKQIKVPNVSGHTRQNYVQVQGAAVKGDLPGRVCDEINDIFNRGVHIWHDHASIGDF